MSPPRANRLWRDGGFAVGALLSRLLAGLYGIPAAITAVAVLTAVSGAVVAVRMRGGDDLQRDGASDSAPYGS
ncbi:sugar (pentulose or hexulose) kinase [Arthrobacter sp. UYEF21]